MDSPTPQALQQAASTAGDQAGYFLKFLGKHGWRLALWFFCLLLPLWGFASLVGELHEKEVFPFDAPLLNFLHARASPAWDWFFVWISRLGFAWGVLPADIVVLLWLAISRRFRDSLFFFLAVAGSEILNVAAKNYFTRDRPSLWLSITPETTYSFPSGHAMASATLGMALIMLFWPSRGRWPVLLGAACFVFLVGVSRIYLGVHYPSDILTGWAAAIAWVVGLHELVARKAPLPPPSAARTEDVVTPAR